MFKSLQENYMIDNNNNNNNNDDDDDDNDERVGEIKR